MRAAIPRITAFDRLGVEGLARLAAATLTFILAIPLWTAPWNQYDGGIAASAATFTLHGLVPYRDYWLLYGPLSGWLLAIPTGILGPSVELTRLAGSVVLAGHSAALYQLCRRWTQAFPAGLLAVSSSLLVGAFLGLEVNAWPLAMTMALSGLGLRLDGRRPLVAGMLIGFAFVARLDVGGYALLAALLLPDRRRLLIGFGLIVLPCALLLLALVPTAALADQLIWYPIVGPRLYRGTPGLEALMPMSIALPMTLVLVVLPRAMVAVTAVRAFATGRRDLLSITLFAALCQLQSFGRADPAHFALAATPAIALVAANLPASPRRALAGVALVAPALFAVVAIGMLSVATNSTTKDTSLQRSITVAREATDPAAAVFVALTSNRYTVGNAPLAYYLADRAPGSRWTMFNPGVTNTDATQTQMVADLEASRTVLLILDSWGAESFEGTNDSRIPGSTILDRYVSERFRTWCDFGAFRVAVRVDWALDRPCPIAEDT